VREVLDRFPGCTTAKVKVAEAGQSLPDDVARVAEVRAQLGVAGRIRVDANGGWAVDDAVRALTALAPYGLEYAEQPCSTLDDLGRLRLALARSGVDLLVAADESIRKADDPLLVAAKGSADVVVSRSRPSAEPTQRWRSPSMRAPRGGLVGAGHLGRDRRRSRARSSAARAAVRLRASDRGALRPRCPHAAAAASGRRPRRAPGRLDGRFRQALAELAAPPDRQRWWLDRLARCHALLEN
jgi:O-succinylbenzoate synthase